MKKVEDYRCKECKSSILFDAWVMWNPKIQDYQIMTITEDSYCETCGINSEVEEITVEINEN